jgi:hypothetical protein
MASLGLVPVREDAPPLLGQRTRLSSQTVLYKRRRVEEKESKLASLPDHVTTAELAAGKQTACTNSSPVLLPQPFELERPNVVAVQEDLPSCWVVEALQQLDDRRFAGPAGAHERHLSSRRDREAEGLEDGDIGPRCRGSDVHIRVHSI